MCPQASERIVPRAPRTGMGQRGVVNQDKSDADSTTPLPEVVPPVSDITTEVSPSQPTTTLTLDVLPTFMLTSMENQALMTQMMQTLVANQTSVQGTKDLGTMTVESHYLKAFQRYKLSSFDGGKVDPIVADVR